jgi:ribosomal protein S5
LDLVRSWRALSTAVVIFQRGERRGDVGIGGGGATEVNYAIYHNYIM